MIKLRHFHEDITVVVVFLDADLISRATSSKCPVISLRGRGITLPHSSLARCAAPEDFTAG
ncbi:hypothetical protein HPP92_013952 [Vanilla planifolia]|uniref:Uncharacterized protein n=1 Tax=Vanilla planifolia TaxID=51239 RepID=A0A835UWF2_VANPL|nr:hypothetical protein HPP92_013952 [Vanilla planifolia]